MAENAERRDARGKSTPPISQICYPWKNIRIKKNIISRFDSNDFFCEIMGFLKYPVE